MKILENTEKIIEMYNLGEVKKILNLIDGELIKNPNPNTFRQRGIMYINYKKKFALKKILEQILKINSKDPEILSRLALIFELNGKIEEASNFADKSLEIDSENKIALEVKGVIAFTNSEYENSINYFDKILIKNKDDTLALLNKGISLEQLGKNIESMECFRKIFDIDSLSDESLDKLSSTIINYTGNEYSNSYADGVLTNQSKDKLGLKIKDKVIVDQNKVRQKIFEMFDRYLHRLPDIEGLEYFEKLITQGTKIVEIEQSMKNSEEGKNYWN